MDSSDANAIDEQMERALAALQSGDLATARELARRTLEGESDHPDAMYVLGVAEHASGNTAAGEDLVRRAIDVEPGAYWYHAALAEMRSALRDYTGAVAALQQAVKLQPDSVPLYEALALNLIRLDRHAEAAEAFARAAALQPNNPEALNNVAAMLETCGDNDRAVEVLQRALAIDQNNVTSLRFLAAAQLGLNDLAAAEINARRAYELAPNDTHVLRTLGEVCRTYGKTDDAIDAYSRALANDPNQGDAQGALAGLLLHAGLVDRAVEHYRQATAQAPNDARLGGEILAMSNYRIDLTEPELVALHRAWGERFVDPLMAGAKRHGNTNESHRKLRVGYVTPDFNAHPITRFMERVIPAHRAAQVEPICFSNAVVQDIYTAKMRKAFGIGAWHETNDMTDAHAAALIRHQGIDVLVDLTGHTGHNRLGVFALRAAPVQITYLGYCNTTGMRAMDWFVGDDVTDPASEDAASGYPEKIARIAGGFACYSPQEKAPPPNELPALSNGGRVTFGIFHPLMRLNDRMLDLWARLMREMPSAHLIFWRNRLHGLGAEELRKRLLARGMDEARFELRHRQPPGDTHLGIYHSVDIALDTLPWSGHTLCCESISMGVPIVTQYGQTHRGRMSASALTSAGCADWIARDEDDYIRIAKDLGADLPRLSETRRTLGEKVRASDLCNASKFIVGWERVIRDAWRAWCAKPRE